MIRIIEQDHLTIIRLNRPERRNALTPAMLDELDEAVRSRGESARAIVLAGAGQVFCAGFDLDLCRASPEGAVMRLLLTGLSRVLVTMRQIRCPIVVAAHSAAIAGGCALLGGADLVVADHGVKLGYPVVRLGVSPAVSAPFLGQSVSGGNMRQLLLEPRLIRGLPALKMGLVHELVDDVDGVEPRAIELAQRLANKPIGGIRATRDWLLELTSMGAGSDAPRRALEASLSLVGQPEEHAMLEAVWGDNQS